MIQDRRVRSIRAKREDPIPWQRAEIPKPEVYELFGEEAVAQWNAAHAMQYKTTEERAFAPTTTIPML